MKIFGIGMMKTGTSSLGFCLKALGYNHAPYTPRLLRQVKQNDYTQLASYIANYESFDDHPWPSLYPWLDRNYPDSKFVLTIRKSSEAWYQSLCKHAKRRGPTFERKLVYGYAMPHGQRRGHIGQYEAHNKAVETYFRGKPGKLLIVCWENGDGWAELCDFLGHAAPNLPFPHANASRGRQINGRRWLRNLSKYLLLQIFYVSQRSKSLKTKTL